MGFYNVVYIYLLIPIFVTLFLFLDALRTCVVRFAICFIYVVLRYFIEIMSLPYRFLPELLTTTAESLVENCTRLGTLRNSHKLCES